MNTCVKQMQQIPWGSLSWDDVTTLEAGDRRLGAKPRAFKAMFLKTNTAVQLFYDVRYSFLDCHEKITDFFSIWCPLYWPHILCYDNNLVRR